MLQPPIPEAKPPATDPYYVESPPEPEEEVDSMPSSPVTVPEPLPSSRVEDVPTSTKPSEAVIHILQYVGRDLAGQLHAPNMLRDQDRQVSIQPLNWQMWTHTLFSNMPMIISIIAARIDLCPCSSADILTRGIHKSYSPRGKVM